MRNSRHMVLRILAMFAIVASFSGAASLTAGAQAEATPVVEPTEPPQMQPQQDTYRLTVTVLEVVEGEGGVPEQVPATGAIVSFPELNDSGTVDENGTRSSVESHPDGTYAFSAGKVGYTDVQGELTIDGADASTTVIIEKIDEEPEPEPGQLTVTVQDEAGSPVQGANVTFGDLGVGGETDGDGNFVTASAYDPGTYDFSVSADGYESQDGSVTVEDGHAGTTVTLIASDEPEPEPGTISVTVEDEEGAIVSDATVTLEELGEQGPVDPETGTFTTSQAHEPGTYEVAAAAPGFLTQTDDVTIEDGDVETTMTLPQDDTPEPEPGTITLGVADADSGAGIEGATVSILDADGEEVAGGLTNEPGIYESAELPAGDYTWTGSADGYVDSDPQEISVDGDVAAEVALSPAGDDTPGTVTIVTFECEELESDGPVFGQEPGDDCTRSSASFTLVGEGETYTLDVEGQASIDVPAGTYEVTENASSGSTTIDVVAGEEYLLPVLSPTNPTPGTFPVTIAVETTDGGSAEGALVTIEDAVNADVQSFFQVAQIDPITGELDANNAFSAELPEGEYIVTIEGTGQGYGVATTTFAVPVEGPVAVALPAGDMPPPADAGTVNASAFYCDNITEVEFFSDQPAMTTAGLPTEEPACEPGAATLSFYLIGDDSGDLTGQLEIDASGSGSIELPAGSYEVVEEGTGASSEIEVLAGDFTTLTVHIPVGDGTGTGQSVNVSKFYCENVTETEFLTVGAGEENSEAIDGAPGCVPGYALFSFYLIGDETDDYAQLEVDGTGTIGLLPGAYEVVEEGAQASFEIEVVEGENTVLVVNNPLPDDGEVPPPGDGDDPGDPKDPKDPDKDKKPDDDAGGVTELPSTGHGAGGSDSTTLMMAAAAASAIAGAGAFAIRRERA